MTGELFPIRWDDESGRLILLDQTLLPRREEYRAYQDAEGVRDAIRDMVVRGAPAIGVTAAYGMALAAQNAPGETPAVLATLREAKALLDASRPTAVNLAWATARMLAFAEARAMLSAPDLRAALRAEAVAVQREDEAICRRIGEHLLGFLHDGDGVLTHCNAGQLATSRYGTATSPLYLARERGMALHVYSDETRPRLQGSSLTALELHRAGIDVTVICDNMAATVMSQGKINAVIVGTDRVAANGDVANKIGTYGVAVLAKHFGIPFYVAAPTPSIDLSLAHGGLIPIEERSREEVIHGFGIYTAPEDVKVYNPGFDVTPHELVTAIVTENGVVYPPFADGLRAVKRD